MAKIKLDPKEEASVTPIQKAFTVERVAGGWQFITLMFQDGQIIDIERSEPDLKAVALEKFKIAAFKYWSTIG